MESGCGRLTPPSRVGLGIGAVHSDRGHSVTRSAPESSMLPYKVPYEQRDNAHSGTAFMNMDAVVKPALNGSMRRSIRGPSDRAKC
jgi:hypothetical protein